MRAILALEDGSIFEGKSFTGEGEVAAEVCFNTSMTGYQEVLTDPSYNGQMVAMTYPLIGSYGINDEDMESGRIQVEAFIVREYQENYSNYRARKSLADFLKEQNILGIEGIDTRRLTRKLRNYGYMNGVISTDTSDLEKLTSKAKAFPGLDGIDSVKKVTTNKAYRWQNGQAGPFVDLPLTDKLWSKSRKFKIAAMDFGVKYNILRHLEQIDAEVIVLPASTAADEILNLKPDGLFLSNGPGDPAAVGYAADNIRAVLGKLPIFGICLGHQLLATALGGTTFKLKFGHRGSNQPVKDLKTGKIEITAQNHGYAVDIDSLDKNSIEVTHVNLNDNTLEGFRHLKLPLFSVQYHPENSPGPHDSFYLFERFAELM